MSEVYNVKIWYSNNETPLIKLDSECFKKLPININKPLLVVLKSKSIEIFNAEVPGDDLNE